jgi:hypothetical protein
MYLVEVYPIVVYLICKGAVEVWRLPRSGVGHCVRYQMKLFTDVEIYEKVSWARQNWSCLWPRPPPSCPCPSIFMQHVPGDWKDILGTYLKDKVWISDCSDRDWNLLKSE